MKKEDLVKFYAKYRSQIFPAIVAISSLFLIVFVIYPQTVKLINNQKAIGEITNKSKLIENKVVALESYDETDLSRKVEFAMATLPVEKDIINILGLLQGLTSESGFSIDSISFGNAPGKPGDSESLEVKLEITGTRAIFQTLLNNFENAPRLVRINSIGISSNQTSQAFNASLAVEVLYSKLPQNFGTTDSPLPEFSQKDEELITKLASLTRVGVLAPGSSAEPSSPRGKSNPFE